VIPAPNAAPDSGGPTRLRLDLSYDGTGFRGWAKQPTGRTVQGELENALELIFRREGAPQSVVVAGRTDAGVHALGQVVHLDLEPTHMRRLEQLGRGDALGALVRKLNGIAGRPGDIRVHRAIIAPDGFDARFGAIWRRYEYRIADAGAFQDPRARSYTVWHPRPLDLDAMDAAARSLAGLADWAAYCRPREGATTIRDLREYSWRRDDEGVLIAHVVADAFCHSMVRALVGACAAVGEGALSVADPVALRQAGERTSAFKVMPAAGLTLMEVGYPPDDQLAERAERTRAHRELAAEDTVG